MSRLFIVLYIVTLAFAFLACSLLGQKPPSRADVERSEDKFCAAVQKVRQAESLAAILNNPEAPATAAGGSPAGK